MTNIRAALVALLMLSATGCTPVEQARINCRQGDQSACIDYMTYSRAGMPGTAASYIQQQRAAGLAPSPYDPNEAPTVAGRTTTVAVPYDPNANF
jgi:hypothetical protein